MQKFIGETQGFHADLFLIESKYDFICKYRNKYIPL